MDSVENRNQVVAIRLDAVGDKGVISEVDGNRGLRTVPRVGLNEECFASGKLSERTTEATRIADERGIPLIVIEHPLIPGQVDFLLNAEVV